jgi:hypothetical protein
MKIGQPAENNRLIISGGQSTQKRIVKYYRYGSG